MVFQQIPPLLLLVSYYLSYYLYVLPVWRESKGGNVTRLAEKRENVLPVMAWKTQPNHTSLWKQAI